MTVASLFLALGACFGSAVPGNGKATVVLVVGAGGAPEFAEQFATWAERWERAAARGGATVVRIGSEVSETPDRDLLKAALERETDTGGEAPLVVVYLGHGTFDGKDAYLNLRGPDASAEELGLWLGPQRRPTAVLVCAASSAPFINQLSRPGRVVMTATRSGDQYSFARFGDALSVAAGDLEADLSRDGQVSLLEAFLYASAQTAAFYEEHSRLATEHALLDDNGDGRGTLGTSFRGVHSTVAAAADRLPDGFVAHQLHLVPSELERGMPPETRRRRDQLELELEKLRAKKSVLEAQEYQRELERILLALARLYRDLDKGSRSVPGER